VITLLCTVRNCARPLVREERTLRCENNHAFDVARSGYINLLQPQDRRSRSPGDSAEAVAARRRFLDAGHAEPLVRAIVEALPFPRGASLLDAGCGEGHHTAAFQRAYEIEAHGVDISVPAIDAAAKRHPECTWIVANADRFLPYADGTFWAISSITARLNEREFHRVLVPGGMLLIALPGADDLLELREAVLGEGVERDRVERTIGQFRPLFELVRHERIQRVAQLGRAAIADVLSSSYRALRTRERERLAELGDMKVTLSRDLVLLRRSETGG
jgi:23S rRNA (guanine745-N1)-methyltransferase